MIYWKKTPNNDFPGVLFSFVSVPALDDIGTQTNDKFIWIQSVNAGRHSCGNCNEPAIEM